MRTRSGRSRALKLSAALAAIALAATACGGDDDDDTTGGADTPTGDAGQAAGECPTDGLSGSLEVAAVWSGAEQTNFELVLDGFTEATGVDVSFTSTGDDINAFLGPRVEGGQPPSVAILPQPALLQSMAGDGALIALGDEAAAQVEANYADVWSDLGSVDGTLYGVWFKAANKSTVWYSASVFSDAGVEPPSDFAGWVEIAGTLQQFGIAPISVGGADGWTLTDWFENVYLNVAGADVYDQLVAHEIPWTDASVTSAFEALNQLFEPEGFVAQGNAGALQVAFPDSVTQVFGASPVAAMVYEGDFVAGVISDQTDAAVGEDALFFPFPTIDGSPPSVVGGGDVAVGFTDDEATQALLCYLATPEAAEIWAAEGGFASPNQNVDTSVYPDEISQQLAEQLTSAEVFRFDLSDSVPSEFGGTVGQGLFKLFQDYLADPGSFADIQQQMEDAAAAAYA